MWQIKNEAPRMHTRGLGALLLTGVLIMGTTPGFSRGPRPETIEASAMGTGTQLGAVIGVTLNIYDFSTPAEKQVLVQAFGKGQNQGLVTALQRMRAVGMSRSRVPSATTAVTSPRFRPRRDGKFASSPTARFDSVKLGRIARPCPST
jgi:hypothetical protein